MKVWELLSDESKWTKRVFARMTDGTSCMPNDPLAASWCAIGAICKCYSNPKENAQASNKVYERLNSKDFSDWNDNGTYQEVYGLFKELDV